MSAPVTRLVLSMGLLLCYPLLAWSGDGPNRDSMLHFDQPQAPITSLEFKQTDPLRPASNDFQIVEASYFSNKLGERWAIVTFENTSTGRRFLKNDAIVATFANGSQAYAQNLDETFKGSERMTKSVFFGIHKFPIVEVRVD